MTPEYAAFLASKAPVAQPSGLSEREVEDLQLPSGLFPHQDHCIRFALRQGRAGIYLDTGLGKSLIEIAYAAHVAEAINRPMLILTPLAVARQMEVEALKWGFEARVIREQSQAGKGVNICNYDRLDKLDPDAFGAVVLDEAGIIKNFAGKTTRALIEAFRGHRFKMAATATPAPNDHMELGQQAEFLGVMNQSEMLVRWFINDASDTGKWRLKKHGVENFWNWMASWSRMAGSPDDLGFDGSAFVLPELVIVRHRAKGDRVDLPRDGLFGTVDVSAANMFAVKRATAAARADVVAELVSRDREPWLVWCDIDAEADALLARIPDAVEVRGSHPVEKKEERIAAFIDGSARILITKPAICGWGLNLQHCARMAFVGRNFSYEGWYQAVRRCWRFGQKRPVEAHIVVAEGEDAIGRVIDRKAEDHLRMKDAMRAAMRRACGRSSAVKIPYEPKHQGRLPTWL